MNYIIVLNWNNYQDTIACVDSLLMIDGEDYRVVICDNGSNDGSQDIIESFVAKQAQELFFIKSEINGGYSYGNNIGIKFALEQADCEYIWVINNDTVVESNTLKFLIDFAKANPAVGVIGSKLVYLGTDIIQGFGGTYNPKFATVSHIGSGYHKSSILPQKELDSQVDYLIGASLFFSKRCLEDVGLLSEDYFLYFEELDYCIRAKQMGFQIAVCQDSVVYHREGGSTESGRSIVSDFYQVRNRLKITKKYFPQYYAFVYLSLFGVLVNRVIRWEPRKLINVIKIMLSNGRTEYKGS